MNQLLIYFLGAIVFIATLSATAASNAIVGKYTRGHIVEFYGEKLEATDSISIQRTRYKGLLSLRVFTLAPRGGNFCKLEGQAKIVGDSLVYDDVDSNCQLRFKNENGSLIVEDVDGNCSAQYCGNNASFANSFKREFVEKKGLLFSSLVGQPLFAANRVLVENIKMGKIEKDNWYIAEDESTCMVFTTKGRQSNVFTEMTMLGESSGKFTVEQVESCR